MQILLQLHDGDETRLVDCWKCHHRALNEWPVTLFEADRLSDVDFNLWPAGSIFRQSALDAKRAAECAGETADIEQVGAVGQQIEPDLRLENRRPERRLT